MRVCSTPASRPLRSGDPQPEGQDNEWHREPRRDNEQGSGAPGLRSLGVRLSRGANPVGREEQRHKVVGEQEDDEQRRGHELPGDAGAMLNKNEI